MDVDELGIGEGGGEERDSERSSRRGVEQAGNGVTGAPRHVEALVAGEQGRPQRRGGGEALLGGEAVADAEIVGDKILDARHEGIGTIPGVPAAWSSEQRGREQPLTGAGRADDEDGPIEGIGPRWGNSSSVARADLEGVHRS